VTREPTLPSGSGTYLASYWDGVVAAWPQESRARALLRAYSDAVNRKLLERWLPAEPVGLLLKTDLFDEAVGAGLYPLLSRRARAVAAVDASPAMVAAAHVRYPDVDARTGDVRALEFADGSFDAVVSNSTLDHFESRDELAAAVRELARVLVPGGLLVLTLDNPVNPLVALRNALPFGPMNRIGLVPYRVGATCGPRRLRALLEASGFEVERTTALMHVPRVLARLAPLRLLLAAEALSRLPTRYLTGQFVAVRAVRR
jgi:SAM-dependent methyltransferase